MAKYYCMLEEKTENVVLCFQQVLELHMFIYNCAVRERVTTWSCCLTIMVMPSEP